MKSLPRLVALFPLCACSPHLPEAPPSTEAEEPLVLELEPATADPTQAPTILRVHARGSAVRDVEPEELVLVRGQLTSNNLGQLAAGLPSEALLDRMIERTVFRRGDEIVLSPNAPLEPGTRYSVGVGSLSATLEIATSPDANPYLARVWPLAEGPAQPFFCGERRLPDVELAAALDPASIQGTLRRGTPHGHAVACVRFDASEPFGGGVAQAPLAFGANGEIALDPSPFTVATGPIAPEPTACAPGERKVLSGCMTVEDDRIVLRGPEEATLWIVSAAGLPDLQSTTQHGSRTVLAGLTPSSKVSLDIEALSLDGRWMFERVEARTRPPSPRLSLHEVYANAVGPEPQQEWIEIFNAGTAPGSLANLTITDVGGATMLPEDAGILEPGAFVLVAREDFDPSGIYDVPPPSVCSIVRVPVLGSHGLSNDGELLRLLAADGETVLSTIPGGMKSKAGQSVARVDVTKVDEDPQAFAIADPPTPCGPNVVE